MAKIRWDESYSVGIPELDSQHQRLIDLINLLDNHAQDRENSQILEAAIKKLTVYAFTHFGHEERLLARAGYPDLANHQAEHDDFGRSLMRFRSEAAAGILDPDRLINFLARWWSHHILDVDMGYKTLLAENADEPTSAGE